MARILSMDKALISPGFPKVRRGRPPLNGVRAMTRAEINKRERDRRNAGKAPKVLRPCPGLIPGPLTAQVSNDSFVRRYIDSNFPDLRDIVRALIADCENKASSSKSRFTNVPKIGCWSEQQSTIESEPIFDVICTGLTLSQEGSPFSKRSLSIGRPRCSAQVWRSRKRKTFGITSEKKIGITPLFACA
jgi:hypothetical protein